MTKARNTGRKGRPWEKTALSWKLILGGHKPKSNPGEKKKKKKHEQIVCFRSQSMF